MHRIVPSTGKTKELSAKNCKEIKETLSTDCGTSPQNGVYWVQGQQVTIKHSVAKFFYIHILCYYSLFRFIVT